MDRLFTIGDVTFPDTPDWAVGLSPEERLRREDVVDMIEDFFEGLERRFKQEGSR